MHDSGVKGKVRWTLLNDNKTKVFQGLNQCFIEKLTVETFHNNLRRLLKSRKAYWYLGHVLWNQGETSELAEPIIRGEVRSKVIPYELKPT